jgi:hypothetical protein
LKHAALLLSAFAIVLAILAAGLRPDAFFVGDSGIKLIAAKNANARPDQPLNIPLPVIGRESLPFVEPFFEVHNDHAHAVTAELFPMISAPFIRWFGIRGAYVLPAIGFLGILLGCAWLAVALDDRRNSALVILIAGLGTPFLFYGLEFWEHAPAVALAASATAMFVTAFRKSRWVALSLAFGSGLAFGVGLLMRPETAWVVLVVLIASTSLDRPISTHRTLLTGFLLVGVALTLAPLEIHTVRHFGRVMPSHLSANSALLQASWIAQREHLARTWFLPSGWTLSGPIHSETFWTAAPLIILALVPLGAQPRRDGRRFLWLVSALTVILIFLTAPNDGGGQWAPRYLLFAYVPLVVLAADAVDALPRRTSTAVVLGLLLVGCIWIQRSAYRQLRGTKTTYGKVVDFVADEVAPRDYVVSDLWWLDQVAASSTSERQFIYVPDAASGHAVMQRLSRAIAPIVTVIRSQSESADMQAWSDETCYVEIRRHTLDVRGLVAIWLHHRCSQ